MDNQTLPGDTRPGQLTAVGKRGLAPHVSLWIGVGIWIVGIAFSVVGILFVILNQATLAAHPEIPIFPIWLSSGLPYLFLGGLIVARRPANKIGWLLSAGGLAGVISFAAEHYAIYALLTEPAGQLLAAEAAWLSSWLWFVWVGFYPLFILLYPDGKPPSPRWRWVVWLDYAIIAVLCLPTMIGTWSVRSAYIFNERVAPAWVNDVFNATFSPLLLIGFLVSLAAAISRYRAAQSTERAQVRWLIYGVALLFLISVLSETILSATPLRGNSTALFSSTSVGFLILPICIGVAIFRYHLFDIDRLINRTLVYVPLTGILAGLYAAFIGVMQRLFQATTGEKSDAAIVLTTLILTAVFTPIKNALQAIVDRRWKEPAGSLKKLKAFTKQVEGYLSPLDSGKVMRRLLTEAALAVGANSGAAYLQRDGRMEIIQTYGAWQEEGACLALSLTGGGEPLGLIRLGDRGWEEEYSHKERTALQEAANAVAAAISA